MDLDAMDLDAMDLDAMDLDAMNEVSAQSRSAHVAGAGERCWEEAGSRSGLLR
jgi:hypothetical protein